MLSAGFACFIGGSPSVILERLQLPFEGANARNSGWMGSGFLSRQTAWHSVYMVLQFLLGKPDIIPVFSMVTWTVRQTTTGAMRKVTARSRQEAEDKIINKVFDAGGPP